MDKVVYLDRDGTINVEKNYLYRIEDFQFIYGVPEAIRLLNQNKYKVIVVTNQAGIARGYYTEADVSNLHNYINDELHKFDAHIDNYFYCPHHPTDGIGIYKLQCNCRKPQVGMFEKSEEFYNIDKINSWMIGDNINDIIAGKSYNINTVLVSTGYGSEIFAEKRNKISFNYYAKDLLEAVKYILKEQSH